MQENHPPYPKPKVLEPNSHYATLLLEDYAGITGELTAINQYVYQYIDLQQDYPDLAKLLKKIAIMEMHHLELLGKTIYLLGETPLLGHKSQGQLHFWSAKSVYYGQDLCAQLTVNMKHEAKAIRNYRRHQRAIHDPYIQALLERIIEDEADHFHQFKQVRQYFGHY